MQEWKRRNAKKVGSVRLGMAMKSTSAPSLMKTQIELDGKPIEFFLDTGAEANVINEDAYVSMGRPCIQTTGTKGKLFDGTLATFLGKGNGTFMFEGKKVRHDFYVARAGSMNILGLQTMEAFDLLDEFKKKIGQNL